MAEQYVGMCDTYIRHTLFVLWGSIITQRENVCNKSSIIIIINSLSSKQNYRMSCLVYYIMNFYYMYFVYFQL